MPLTHEQIWATAAELEASGIEPTLVAVRKALGGGSYSTLSDAMAERRKQLSTKGLDAKEPLPPALTQMVERLGQQIWASATAYAHERLKSDREQFDRMRSDLEGQRTEAAGVASAATADLEAAQLRIEALEADAKTLRGKIDEVNAQLATAAERLAASTARGDEAGHRVSDLNRELERISEANASLIGALGGPRPDPQVAKAGRGTAAAISKAPKAEA
jgi:chromosome segregation ATPase